MTQPRRHDEIALFARLRQVSPPCTSGTCLAQPGLRNVEGIGRELGIAPRRLEYLLLKWGREGWWDWGMCPEGGWFTEAAPERLHP